MMSRPTPKPRKVVVSKSATLSVLKEIMEQRESPSPELAAKQARLLAVLAPAIHSRRSRSKLWRNFLSNPDQQPTDTEPDAAAVPAAAKPKPVLYTFTCGGAKVPCKLAYTFDSDLHKQRKLPAPK